MSHVSRRKLPTGNHGPRNVGGPFVVFEVNPMAERRPQRRCTATSSRTGDRCRRAPIKGGLVCTTHGGMAPQVRRAAAENLVAAAADADATRLLAHEGLKQVTDPVGELAKLATEAWAMKDALAARVNALDSIRYEGSGPGGEQLRAEVALYERALDRSGKFLEVLAKLGYEERRVRVEEEQAALVARVLTAALAEVGLGDRSDEVLRVVARRLEATA